MNRTCSSVERVSPGTTSVLDRARAARRAVERTEAEVLVSAVEWAKAHPAQSIHDAATSAGYGENALAVAGASAGAPLVAEFCIVEFAAAAHLPTPFGKELVGDALGSSTSRSSLTGWVGRRPSGWLPRRSRASCPKPPRAREAAGGQGR